MLNHGVARQFRGVYMLNHGVARQLLLFQYCGTCLLYVPVLRSYNM